MILHFPRGRIVDTVSMPEDFEGLIQSDFAEYTSGTASEFTHCDKLGYIDLCVKYLRGRKDDYEAVADLVKGRFAYEFEEHGSFADESDFLSVEFMETCYAQGVADAELDSDAYADGFKANDQVKRLLCRAIKAVMGYEKGAR